MRNDVTQMEARALALLDAELAEMRRGYVDQLTALGLDAYEISEADAAYAAQLAADRNRLIGTLRAQCQAYLGGADLPSATHTSGRADH